MTATLDATKATRLKQALDALPERLRRRILLGASRAGSRVLANAAKTNIRDMGLVESGDLLRSVRVSKPRRQLPGQALTQAKAGDKRAYYAMMLEFGVAPHSLARGADRDPHPKLQERTPHHPGLAPRPYMRAALDTHAQQAIDATGDYIRRRFERLGTK